MEKAVLESMPPAQRASYEVSRRKALGIATKYGLGGAAAAALGAGIRPGAVREALAADLPQKPYNITFVNHVTTNPFFTPTVYGIEDACAFFGCEYQWTGSLDYQLVPDRCCDRAHTKSENDGAKARLSFTNKIKSCGAVRMSRNKMEPQPGDCLLYTSRCV